MHTPNGLLANLAHASGRHWLPLTLFVAIVLTALAVVVGITVAPAEPVTVAPMRWWGH